MPRFIVTDVTSTDRLKKKHLNFASKTTFIHSWTRAQVLSLLKLEVHHGTPS